MTRIDTLPTPQNINIPGLKNSGQEHWQSIWEASYPGQFHRVNQEDWINPDCEAWIQTIEEELKAFEHGKLILIGHSVGCATIVHWHQRFQHNIKGALFVAPSDVDKPDYPKYITGFSPMPLKKLPFPSIVVASSDDHVVSPDRAKHFSECWGSQLMMLENAGHVEPKSGFGKWDQGLNLIQQLREG